MSTIFIDFETFSEAELTEVGAYRYAHDASTRILMVALAWDDEPVQVFAAGAVPSTVRERWHVDTVAGNATVVAHNAQFEIAVASRRMKADLALSVPPLKRWQCTAALCRVANIHARLEDAAKDLRLTHQKDAEGKRLIQLFSVPNKLTGDRVMPEELPVEFEKFKAYCAQDVEVERAIWRALQAFHLRGTPLALTWEVDKHINARGFPVNITAVKRASVIVEEELEVAGAEFAELTGLRPTQRAKVMAYLQSRGYPFANMQAMTMDDAEERLDEWCRDAVTRRVFELYRELVFTATAKLRTMRACASPIDNRVRGGLLFYGAHTGRWSGVLVQPQNFKRPTFKQTDAVYADICRGGIRTADAMRAIYGPPVEVLGSCIRHFIQPPEGALVIDADYAAIEARVLCWLAGQDDAVKRFFNNEDSYVDMATVIFGAPAHRISKDQRWLGKQTVLGCGYQMGYEKFYKQCVTNAKKFKIKGLTVTEDMAGEAVDAFRAKYAKVAALWKTADTAARQAIMRPGTVFACGKLRFHVSHDAGAGMSFLHMRLPSGRSLHYPRPRLKHAHKGQARTSITYYGQIPGTVIWGDAYLYGGKLVENAVQAICGDIMAHGSAVSIRNGYDVFLLVHDEALAEHRQGQTAEEFCKHLCTLPEWAAGVPIAAEGEIIPYYKKI